MFLFCALESCLNWLIMELTIKIFLCCVRNPMFFLTNIEVFIKTKGLV